MKSPSLSLLTLFAALLTLLTACSPHDKDKDKTVAIEGDDAEMTAAIAQARETLPQFWKIFQKSEHGESDFALKVMVTDPHGIEHFWAIDLVREDGKIMGTINNDPNTVASVKFGDRIEIPEKDITDWVYMRDGKMVGNRTLKPLFKNMPAEEVAKLKMMMADP